MIGKPSGTAITIDLVADILISYAKRCGKDIAMFTSSCDGDWEAHTLEKEDIIDIIETELLALQKGK